MKIGGLNKFSLSDFPGKVAAVVSTQGCNFRCPYCYNGSLISPDVFEWCLIPQEEFFEFLQSRTKQLDGIVVSGGEPTIQAALPEFLARIKSEGFLVKLDTNGSQPQVLREVLQSKLVDFVAMDVKAPLGIYDRLTGIRTPTSKILESIELIARSKVAHQFRTTVVKALLSPRDIKSIDKLIPSGSAHRLQKFRPEHALDSVLRTRTKEHLGG